MLLSECTKLHEGVTVYDMYGEIYNNDLGIKFTRHGLIPKSQFAPEKILITSYQEGQFKMPNGAYSNYLLNAQYLDDNDQLTGVPYNIWADEPGENLLSRIQKV